MAAYPYVGTAYGRASRIPDCQVGPSMAAPSGDVTVVRPLSSINLPAHVRRVKLCNRFLCRGQTRCTFAHNIIELNEWNLQLRARHDQTEEDYAASTAQYDQTEVYAASKPIFEERIVEDLDPTIIEAPLTRDNYKKRFHNMICWEEKRHIEILDTKCSGRYTLVLYQLHAKPRWKSRSSDDFVRYGHLEGIDADTVANVTQASEAAFVIGENNNEIRLTIMKENFNHSDEHLYIGLCHKEIVKLKKLFPDLPNSNVSYSQVKVEFEVKHGYFNNLIRSVSNVDIDTIKRLLPKPEDFLPRLPNHFEYTDEMRPIIGQLEPCNQLNALKTICMYPSISPPILINGSFGTGKSRVLALATYYITKKSAPVRILLCAHHHASADYFGDTYFSEMIEKYSWRVRFIRLTSRDYNPHTSKAGYHVSFDVLNEEVRKNRRHWYNENVVITTTFLGSIRLKHIFQPGFFTHILLDEGAQSREPEAIAPLSLASRKTKIIIAGDSNQVGPALLVLGDEARDSGLKLSLLERLQMEYEKIGGLANEYSVTLSTNYRCHKDILAIPHQLFYKGLKSHAHKAVLHPNARYPMLFICSNLTSEICSADVESRILLEQVKIFIGDNWPQKEWGNYDLASIAIVTATHPQLVKTRQLLRQHPPFKKFERIRLLPCYNIQGQEFQAVFLSTTEPVNTDGSTRNDSKSPCDRYVFNTVLTRARSLVVVVGSPLVLLNIETHMVKHYGMKGKCWSLYLKSCLERNTFIIPTSVEHSELKKQQFKAHLKGRLGVVNANAGAIIHRSSTKSSHLVGTKSEMPSPTMLRPLNHKPTTQIRINASNTQCTAASPVGLRLVPNSGIASKNKSHMTGVLTTTTTLVKKQDSVSSRKHISEPQREPLENRAVTGSKQGKAKPIIPPQQKLPNRGKQHKNSRAQIPNFKIDSADDFPSLKDATKEPMKSKAHHKQTGVNRQQNDTFDKSCEKLEVNKVLEEYLTRDNYVENFHQLVTMEEKEHEKILNDKCNDWYAVTFCSPKYHPRIYDAKDRHKHVRYGFITGDNGDILAYAKQASEASFIILNEGTRIRAEHVRADISKEFSVDANSIVFGLEEIAESTLVHWKRSSKQKSISERLKVQFEVKHLYFNGLHAALNKIKHPGVKKMIPHRKDFYPIPKECPMPGITKHYRELDLDSYQQRALFAILNCPPGAPILITGPFGTGKTRLLVRAAYEILKNPDNRVLICAHHQNSVDTFVDYFGKLATNVHKPWRKKFVRIILNYSYRSKTCSAYPSYFKTREDISSIDSYALVMTTLGTSHTLRKKGRNNFTHILIDEGAQTREPETISPLCFASHDTKVIIAGDHLQVGPRVLVLGKEVHEQGLGTSLLERLHSYYTSKAMESVTKQYTVNLLTNYRCHSAILMLPSHLFYGSTLQCRSEEKPHPLAPFPFQFICSSINQVQCSIHGKDETEADILLEQVNKYVSSWPHLLWGEMNLESICIISPSADQFALIKRKLHKKFGSLSGITVLKSDDIQGREFRAVFLGTSDVTSENGVPINPTKTIYDPFIFNTAVTRSKSLVVAVGNPYLILHTEKQCELITDRKTKCWRQFMKWCLDFDTFHFSDQAKSSEKRGACRTFLYKELHGHLKMRIEIDNSDKQGDSILRAYQKELEKIQQYKKTKLLLAHTPKTDVSWILNSSPPTDETVQLSQDGSDEDEIIERYDCVLNFLNYREAEAIPINPNKKVVTIRGSGNRIGAFDGDTFEVGVFRDNPEGKCYGKVLKLKERGGEATFICRVSHHNPVMFYPVDRKNPKFINLPRISRDLLLRRDKDAVKDELQSTDVIVFDHHAINPDSKELTIPPICQVVPHNIAKDMLFIVAYLRWKEPYRVPLGIVIGVLPKGYTSFSAERLLQMKHGIVYDEDERDMNPGDDAISTQHSGPTFNQAFTIDPENAQNLDDAVSLVRLPQPAVASPQDSSVTDTYQLAVHIVNCAKHIQENDLIDREARKRGTSVYGGRAGKIMQMLPLQTREMLSLRPNKLRDVLSVISTVTIDNGNKITITDVKIRQAQIRSCVQLTYMNAQAIMDGAIVPNLDHALDSQEDQPSLAKTLQLLYKIACSMRKQRLACDAAYCYNLSDPEDSECWQAHLLIEELMIWANSTVAQQVHSFYPNAALLRRQPFPNSEHMKAILDQHQEQAKMSLSLSSLVDQQESTEQPHFVLTTKLLSLIKKAISSKKIAYLTSLLFSEYYYPQLAAVHSQLRLNVPRAEYCCTDASNSSYHHYSLKVDHYTHFSSPLRRYIDIQVQRMVMELPEVRHPGLFSTSKEFQHEEHKTLCSQLNKKTRNASQFERSLSVVDLAVKYGYSSEVYDAFIAENTKGSVVLWFPQLELKNIPQKERKIPLKNLGPYANVKEEELLSNLKDNSQEGKVFKWKIKMTSFSPSHAAFLLNVDGVQIQAGETSGNNSIAIEVFSTNADPDDPTLTIVKHKAIMAPATVAIPFNEWNKALDFVKEPSIDKLKEVERILPNIPTVHPPPKSAEPALSQYFPFIICNHQTSFKPHEVVRVWMTKSMRDSVIAPTIQLVEVNQFVRICVQHNSHPAECFSDQKLSNASKKAYTNIDEYVQVWEKVLLAEAAETSVKECKQVIIHDVKLDWPELTVPSNCIDEEYYYQTKGSVTMNIPENFAQHCSEFISFNEGDLVCVRYGTDSHANARGIFHMVIHKIYYSKEDRTRPEKAMMKFIGDVNCKISEQVKKTVLESRCEIQLISLSTSYQRVYHGLQKLLEVGDDDKDQTSRNPRPKITNKSQKEKLVHFVALGKDINIEVNNEGEVACGVFNQDAYSKQLWSKPQIALNEVQVKAATSAFTKPFQLIQGPPGTGKSETGAHIAYTFAMANRQLGSSKKCVLYCGPSNKSVDVVLDKLNKLSGKVDLKILRIYGRAVEARDFPGPDSKGKLDQSAVSEYTCPKWAKKYALHHKIREGPCGDKIKRLETEFMCIQDGSIPDGPSRRTYRRALIEAEEAVLADHDFDIVLCTCNEAASYRVLKCVFPRQCIIDECGMAYEPECIAPLLLCDHAVLLGDHKQLQPVITYPPAKYNGLSTSLFQRYAENFKDEYTMTLTIQYRMNEAICEFPSKQFYNRKLKTADAVKRRKYPGISMDEFWPGPKNSKCPIAFCNVVGKEGDLETGGSAAGGKKVGTGSKFNTKEADKVVEIIQVLNKRHKIENEQIAVLTPYSAQKNVIEDKLSQKNLSVKVASITQSQGDEYDIVILSTVRSLPVKEIANPKHVQADRGWLLEHLGFLTDAHQLNVGITRSRFGLIIVGNKHLLRYDDNWKALIEHYQEKHCLFECDKFPQYGQK